ncbi:MAG: response regulator [Clostridia bacterium]|nr:response regulator [Clostridia bacterium]
MNILAIDDERSALNILVRAISEAAPDANIMRFERTDVLLSTLQAGDFVPDVAFLDIEMPNMNGLELAKHVKDLCPNVNIIFVTGFSRYALDAIAIRPSGYMMKPATVTKVLAELHHLRNLPAEAAQAQRLNVQCFGNFEVFFNGAPLRFANGGAKALFAYLIDRKGAKVSVEEVTAVLGEALGSGFGSAIAELTRLLAEIGAQDVLLQEGEAYAVRADAMDCDYYDFLNGDPAAVNRYTGKYMSQYDWAKMSVSPLVRPIGD